MNDHEWCRDVRRDEAVRAAEDAAAVPAIMHRDLPEVVAALTERVARLEAAQATLGSGDEIARLTAERDAAKEECERLQANMEGHSRMDIEREIAVEEAWERCGLAPHWPDDEPGTSHRFAQSMEVEIVRLRACVAELERAYSAECEARAQAQRELSDLNDAIRARESGEERDSSYAALCREAAAARERADSMMPAKLAPAANAGGESNHESAGGAACGASESAEPPRTPSRSGSAVTDGRPDATAGPVAWALAWAVWGRGTICGVTVSREDAECMQRKFAFDTELLPLYNAPQRPRCWLTAAERACIEKLLTHTFDGAQGKTLTMLLARSTPPKVKRPNPNVVITTVDARERIDRQWIAAIRAAGGEVEW